MDECRGMFHFQRHTIDIARIVPLSDSHSLIHSLTVNHSHKVSSDEQQKVPFPNIPIFFSPHK